MRSLLLPTSPQFERISSIRRVGVLPIRSIYSSMSNFGINERLSLTHYKAAITDVFKLKIYFYWFNKNYDSDLNSAIGIKYESQQ